MRYLKYIKTLTVGLISLVSLVLAFLMRPIQDDYFNLESVQQMGVLGYLEETWNHHGGNMVQFLFHCVVILPTTQQFVFWNLSLFFLLTQVLVFFSINVINSWLFESKSNVLRFWVPLLSVAGFEGLFVPGFLGAFGFSLASLAHLWPVMAFILALFGLRYFKGSWIFALMLGLVAGNSNLGESAFCCGVWIFSLIASRFMQDFSERSGLRLNSNFYSLGLGSLIGSVGIVAAPGFWNRASDQVGLPHSLGDFLRRFAKSFASFTADGLTHPMVWVLFLLGVLLASSKLANDSKFFFFRVKMLACGTFLIWISLVFGSTFAYPAWHQSMGMYVLLLPLSFALGTIAKVHFSHKLIVFLLIISSLTTALVFLRVGVLGIERSLRWDRNLAVNSCRIMENPDSQLLGAEIQYPPFRLGVDDVNTWEWMRSKYVGWVEAIPEKNENCD